MLSVVGTRAAPSARVDLTSSFCEGARRMLAAALEAEVEAYIAARAAERDERGHRLVVRNGQPSRARSPLGRARSRCARRGWTTAGSTGERERVPVPQLILPPWCRKRPEGDRGAAAAVPARPVHRGLRPGAGRRSSGPRPGCRRRSITRLTDAVAGRAAAFAAARPGRPGLRLRVGRRRPLQRPPRRRPAVHPGHRRGRADGTKELVAVADGYRESTESWADLLRDLRRRGMRAPVLAVGDGALGFWAALREVFPPPETSACWVHKIANVLDAACPRPCSRRARRALAEISDAEDREPRRAGDRRVRRRATAPSGPRRSPR